MTIRPTKVTTYANIALIKYWGKADVSSNLPAVGSLSLALSPLKTVTEILQSDNGLQTFSLNRKPMPEAMQVRVQNALNDFGVDSSLPMTFATENFFPTAAGLASSASGGAAMTLAFEQAFDLHLTEAERIAKTLKISGSAPRSLYQGFVALKPQANGTVELEQIDMPTSWNLHVLVIVTAQGEKKNSSRDAMEHSKTSPFYNAWVSEHAKDLEAAIEAIQTEDFDQLMQLMEWNTLKMHALPTTSNPAVWYWNATTLKVLEQIRESKEQGLTGGFTMDAGPHVKLFCHDQDVTAWTKQLSQVPGVLRVIDCQPAPAPIVEIVE